MSSLFDILQEPEDGTTVVLTGPMICGHLIVTRDDGRAAREGYEYSHWYAADPNHWNQEALTWPLFTKYATRVWALGPLLAEVEADR